MENCIFCKITAGEIPSKKVFEDDTVLAFYDINAQAPVHVIVIPKKHIVSAKDIDASNSVLIARIFEVIAELSPKLGLEKGFRIINNCGEHGCQSVGHIHFHLLGGKQLKAEI